MKNKFQVIGYSGLSSQVFRNNREFKKVSGRVISKTRNGEEGRQGTGDFKMTCFELAFGIESTMFILEFRYQTRCDP